jgi:hypothetical protein
MKFKFRVQVEGKGRGPKKITVSQGSLCTRVRYKIWRWGAKFPKLDAGTEETVMNKLSPVLKPGRGGAIQAKIRKDFTCRSHTVLTVPRLLHALLISIADYY